MSPDQLETIVNNSCWNEDKMEWVVPNFFYRERMVSFPKLQGGKNNLNGEKEKKEVIFKNNCRTSQQIPPQDESLKLNNVVRKAR
jgi:hypothetical protein